MLCTPATRQQSRNEQHHACAVECPRCCVAVASEFVTLWTLRSVEELLRGIIVNRIKQCVGTIIGELIGFRSYHR